MLNGGRYGWASALCGSAATLTGEGCLRATGREHLHEVRTVDPWLSSRLSETFWAESLDDV